MTEPLPPATAPELIVATGVEEVKENAKNLELTWGLQPATVASVSGTEVQATYDGDTVPIPMISLAGILLPGDRVMAVFVPPSGNYIIKNFTHREGVLVVAGKQFTAPGAFISSTTSASEIAFFDCDIDVPMIEGNWYHIFMDFDFFINSTTAVFIARIREDSISGTIVGSANLVPGSGNVFTQGRVDTWIRATSTGTQTYVITGQRNIAGVVSWGASANDGHETLQAHDYGSASIVVDF